MALDLTTLTAAQVLALTSASAKTNAAVALTASPAKPLVFGKLGAPGAPSAQGLTFTLYKADAAAAVPGEWRCTVALPGYASQDLRLADITPADIDDVAARLLLLAAAKAVQS